LKNPDEYAAELLSRKGRITEFLLAHTITKAMRDTRDACARMIESEAQTFTPFTPGMEHAAHLLRSQLIIGGPVKAIVEADEVLTQDD
jgi:hypothetical protein